VGTPVRVEKCKWDQRVSAANDAYLVTTDRPLLAWFVPAGSDRRRPERGTVDPVATDELWITATDEWWVLCACAEGDAIVEVVLHAAAPVESPTDVLVRWIDLDLDFEVRDGLVALEDEEEFHRHAGAMAYPKHVIQGAWSGISRLAPRYTTGEWPFDGFLEQTLARARRESGSDRPLSPG
jgi:hypothetical protein